MHRRRGAAVERDVERLLRDGVETPGGDARLLHRYLAEGDESAFEALVDRHGPRVLALCRRHLREPADVEDAFQATFLVLVRKGPSLRDGDALSSWLHGVAFRVASRARSDLLRRRGREGDPAPVEEAAAEAPAPLDDALEALDRELARLPEKYRAPLVLCHLEGKTYDQAAAELGWPPGTVRSRTARARALLRDRLTRLGVEAPAGFALLRLDLAAPLPPSSLVAATVAAAGRFLGPSTPAWPASNLALGVIHAMSPSPWKLLGLGLALAATGLAAGALAVATAGPPAPTPQDPPAEPPPPAAKAEARPPDRRLDALEAKLDRLVGLVEKSTASPPPAPRGPNVDAAAPIVFAPRGLRDIEAQLLNAHENYERRRTLVDRGVAGREELDLIVQQVRVLFARLLDMKDEHEILRRAVERQRNATDELRAAYERKERAWNERQAIPSSLTVEIRDKQAAAEQARREADDRLREAREKLWPLESQFHPLEDRAEAVEELIAWTKEHFRDAKLTLDDAP